MAFIWSSESLEALFENPSEDVRNWAASKFLDLYPDMFERVIGLLPTAPEGTASRILHHLVDLNVHITNPDPFVEILRGSARWDIKALSAALLLRSGYSLLHSEIESVSLAETAFAIASTEQGFDVLLELYKETSQNPEPILHGIAEACGFTHLFNNLLQAKGKGEIRTAREYFSKLWLDQAGSLVISSGVFKYSDSVTQQPATCKISKRWNSSSSSFAVYICMGACDSPARDGNPGKSPVSYTSQNDAMPGI